MLPHSLQEPVIGNINKKIAYLQILTRLSHPPVTILFTGLVLLLSKSALGVVAGDQLTALQPI